MFFRLFLANISRRQHQSWFDGSRNTEVSKCMHTYNYIHTYNGTYQLYVYPYYTIMLLCIIAVLNLITLTIMQICIKIYAFRIIYTGYYSR